jgi:hypothetical protein
MDEKLFIADLRNATQPQREQLQTTLANAFQNAVGKTILNFGKTIVPVARDWAKLYELTAVDDTTCDYECATNLCFSPEDPLNPDF